MAAAPAIPPLVLARRFWPFARPYRRVIAAGLRPRGPPACDTGGRDLALQGGGRRRDRRGRARRAAVAGGCRARPDRPRSASLLRRGLRVDVRGRTLSPRPARGVLFPRSEALARHSGPPAPRRSDRPHQRRRPGDRGLRARRPGRRHLRAGAHRHLHGRALPARLAARAGGAGARSPLLLLHPLLRPSGSPRRAGEAAPQRGVERSGRGEPRQRRPGAVDRSGRCRAQALRAGGAGRGGSRARLRAHRRRVLGTDRSRWRWPAYCSWWPLAPGPSTTAA